MLIEHYFVNHRKNNILLINTISNNKEFKKIIYGIIMDIKI